MATYLFLKKASYPPTASVHSLHSVRTALTLGAGAAQLKVLTHSRLQGGSMTSPVSLPPWSLSQFWGGPAVAHVRIGATDSELTHTPGPQKLVREGISVAAVRVYVLCFSNVFIHFH